MTAKVFLDANVLVAGSASRTGASRAVLALGEIGLVQLYATRQVIDETERNIRQKIPQALPIYTELLIHLQLQVLVDPALASFKRWISIIEEKDAPILEAAVQLPADYLLSLNTKDFTPKVAGATGLNIQTPAIFIQNIRDILKRNL